MSQIAAISITAPAFFGLNKQDSSVDLPVGFAQTAHNCIIDRYGRLGARMGWAKANSTSTPLGANDIESSGELITTDGVAYTLCAGNGKLFKLSAGALVELTYGGGGVAPTIATNNWQIACLNGIAYFFQRGHDPLVFDPAVSTTTFKRVSEKSGYAGTVPQGNTVISAYGRLWVADTTGDKVTVAFSDLLAGHIWTGGSSGSINISNVFPSGADEIVTLGAHNGFLVMFAKRQIVIYAGATTPSTMTLQDTISNIGCYARDSVQNIGTDLLFLSGTGVRSLGRTIQEKSNPINDISKNVRSNLIQDVSGRNDEIKSIYSDVNGFYLLTAPNTSETYCFDTRAPLQDGAFRVTTWSLMPKSFAVLRDKTLLFGMAGYLGVYSTYLDDASTYEMSWYSTHMGFGDPNNESIVKKVGIVAIGGNGQIMTCRYAYDFGTNYRSQAVLLRTFTVYEYGIAEYGLSEYVSGILVNTAGAHIGGSGKIVQIGFDATINGAQLSYQKIDIYTKNGKIVM